MRKRDVTPRDTAAALMLASQACHLAAREEYNYVGGTDRSAVESAAVSASIALAGAITYLAVCGRRDARFEFPTVRAVLLEFLPVLLVGGADVTPDRLLLAGRQLDELAQEIHAMLSIEPKKLTWGNGETREFTSLIEGQ